MQDPRPRTALSDAEPFTKAAHEKAAPEIDGLIGERPEESSLASETPARSYLLAFLRALSAWGT
jgi:hypothetical protein